MGTLINLRQKRKQRRRDEDRATGHANAARHGESKPARKARKAEAGRADKALDGHRLDGPADD